MHAGVRSAENPVIPRAIGVVVFAASVGGVESLVEVLGRLPGHFPVPVIVALHLPRRSSYHSELPRVLQQRTALRMLWAEASQRPEPGSAYLAPQDSVTTLGRDGLLEVRRGGPRPRFCPPANPLLETVAEQHGARAVAVILSGALDDGARGASAISRAGGVVIVQDRATSVCFSMPWATMQNENTHYVLPDSLIASALVTLLMATGARPWFHVYPGAPITRAARDVERRVVAHSSD